MSSVSKIQAATYRLLTKGYGVRHDPKVSIGSPSFRRYYDQAEGRLLAGPLPNEEEASHCSSKSRERSGHVEHCPLAERSEPRPRGLSERTFSRPATYFSAALRRSLPLSARMVTV
jgi:hypothetical protein